MNRRIRLVGQLKNQTHFVLLLHFVRHSPPESKKAKFFIPDFSKKAQTESLIFMGSPESLDVFLCFNSPGLVVEHHVTSCGYVLTLSEVDGVEVLTFDRFCYSTQHFYNLKGQCYEKIILLL